MQIDSRALIRAWVIQLAKNIPKSAELGDLALRMDQMVDLLASRAPGTLFTADSLEFCLRRFKFWPSYAEIWGRLQEYQRQHTKPEVLALPGVIPKEALPGMDATNRFMVSKWNAIRAGSASLPEKVTLAGWLDVCRTKCTPAFRQIVRLDSEAAAIARRQGWPIGEPESASELERAAARDEVGFIKCAFHAPRPQPPDPSHALAAFEAKHGRPAGSLTPEQLEALRGQNGRLDGARKANADIAAQREREAAEASFPRRDYPGNPEAAQPPLEADSRACPKPEQPPRHRMPWDNPS